MRSLLRQATRQEGEPLNILSFATHERYQHSMSKCGHNFYLLQIPGQKLWDTTFAPIPDNYTILDNNVPPYLNIDLILSQDRASHHPGATKLAASLGVPVVNLQHTLPPPSISRANLYELQNRRGILDVFVSEYSRKCWGSEDSKTAHTNMTGIDTEIFKPLGLEKDGTVLTVANQFAKRGAELGFNEWVQTVGFPDPVFNVKVIGDTPGLSVPAQDTTELVRQYNMSVLYLNTTIVSTLPTVIIEAMSCGLPIVTTNTCLIPDTLVEHGVNGLVSKHNDPMELRYLCQTLLEDPSLAAKMGQASREKAEREFTVDRFASKWDEIFREAANIRTM